jgi:hypothetical protein
LRAATHVEYIVTNGVPTLVECLPEGRGNRRGFFRTNIKFVLPFGDVLRLPSGEYLTLPKGLST